MVYLFGQCCGWEEGYKVLYYIKIELSVLFRESITGNVTERDYFKDSLDKSGAWNCSFKIWIIQQALFRLCTYLIGTLDLSNSMVQTLLNQVTVDQLFNTYYASYGVRGFMTLKCTIFWIVISIS